MSNNLDALYNFVRKIAQKELNNSNISTVMIGNIETSNAGSYSVKLQTGEVVNNIIPIGNDYSYVVGEQVYLTLAEVGGFKKYYIYGRLVDTHQEYFNSSEWERFHPTEGAVTQDESLYAFPSNSENDYAEKRVFDITGATFKRDLKQKGSFMIQGDFTCLSNKDNSLLKITDYGVKIRLYTSTETILKRADGTDAEYIFSAAYFSGQPYNMNNLNQRKIFSIGELQNPDTLDTLAIYIYCSKSEEEAFGESENFSVKNVIFQIGQLNNLEENMTVEIKEANGQRDYFTYGTENNQINVVAVTHYNEQVLSATSLKYYWFVKDSSVSSSTSDGYCSYGGFGWHCLNSYSTSPVIDILGQKYDGVKIWSADSSTLNIAATAATETNYAKFKQFKTPIKCVVRYQNATVSSDEYIIYNFNYCDVNVSLTSSATPSLILNDTDTVILTCETEVENSDVTSTLTYTWQVKSDTSDTYSDIVSDSSFATLTIISDSQKAEGYDSSTGQYNLLDTEKTYFRCEVTIEVSDASETKVTEDVWVQSYVQAPETIKQVTYYKYCLSNDMNVEFSESSFAEEKDSFEVYFHTLDTKIREDKEYYSYDSDEGYEKVASPVDTELSLYYEKYLHYKDWDVPTSAGTNGVHTYDWVIQDKYEYNEIDAYNTILTDNELFDTIMGVLNTDDTESINRNPYLYYTSQKLWFSEKGGVHTFLKTEDWQSPKILRQVIQSGGTVLQNITGALIDQKNIFNQLTNNGNEEGIFYEENTDETKHLFINASHIKTGTLTVADNDSNIIFSATVDKDTSGGLTPVQIGGFQVDAKKLFSDGGDTVVNTFVGLSPGYPDSGTSYSIWAGHALPSLAPFSVTIEGVLTATEANITGEITATKLTIEKGASAYLDGSLDALDSKISDVNSDLDTLDGQVNTVINRVNSLEAGTYFTVDTENNYIILSAATGDTSKPGVLFLNSEQLIINSPFFKLLHDGTKYTENYCSIGGWKVTMDGLYNNIDGIFSGMCSVQEDVVFSEGLSYTKNTDGASYTVSRGDCTDTRVVIPSEYRDTSELLPLPVTAIGDAAFEGYLGLTSVVIPDSVTSIGRFAFRHCDNLTSITIPNSVTSLGSSAFHSCDNLASVVIGDRVTSIDQYTFTYCRKLTSVVIPNSVTSIGYRAFRDCSGLTEIVIPDGVTSIGKEAFYNCINLTTVYYTGGEDSWNAIRIGGENSYLTDATRHYYRSSISSNCTSLVSENETSPPRFFAGSFKNIPTVIDDAKFLVLEDGSLYAEAAKIKGEIKADSGEIGGWQIGTNCLISQKENVKLWSSEDATEYAITAGSIEADFLISSPGEIIIYYHSWDEGQGSTMYDDDFPDDITWAIKKDSQGHCYISNTSYEDITDLYYYEGRKQLDGTTYDYWVCDQGGTSGIYTNIITKAQYPFALYNDGSLYAVNANISGTINADSGTIGCFTIDSDNLGQLIVGANDSEGSYQETILQEGRLQVGDCLIIGNNKRGPLYENNYFYSGTGIKIGGDLFVGGYYNIFLGEGRTVSNQEGPMLAGNDGLYLVGASAHASTPALAKAPYIQLSSSMICLMASPSIVTNPDATVVLIDHEGTLSLKQSKIWVQDYQNSEAGIGFTGNLAGLHFVCGICVGEEE